MDETLLLIQCAVIGFSIALPVGPVAILCIRRTISNGVIAGYATGIGATLADVIYGAIAVYGVAFVADFLLQHQKEARIVGAVILIGMGWYYVGHRPPNVGDPVAADREHKITTLLRFFFSAFAITLFNPLTIGAFAAVFAAAGISTSVGTHARAMIAIAGCGIGAAAWWFLLCVVSQAARRYFSHNSLQWLNWVSGGMLLVLGTAIAASLVVPSSWLPY